MEEKKRYKIVLGDSLSSVDKELLLLRYSFIPLSLDRSKKGVISLQTESNEAKVDFFDSFGDNGSRRFKGSYKNPPTNDYCLVFHGDYFSLERVGGYINQLALGTDE